MRIYGVTHVCALFEETVKELSKEDVLNMILEPEVVYFQSYNRAHDYAEDLARRLAADYSSDDDPPYQHYRYGDEYRIKPVEETGEPVEIVRVIEIEVQ